MNKNTEKEIVNLTYTFCRPLPEAALKYARGDTHYLLYIYDQLRNALIDKANGLTNLLQSVYTRSTDLCKMVRT